MFLFTHSLTVVILCCATIVYCACPLSWIQHGNDCYHYSTDQKSWIGSMQMCHRLGGGLVEIDDQEEQAYIQTHTSSLNRMYWIGVSDLLSDGTWTWMYTNKTLGQDSFSNWRPGNPNNSTGHDNCGLIFPSGKWDDVVCTFDTYYICEWDEVANANNQVG